MKQTKRSLFALAISIIMIMLFIACTVETLGVGKGPSVSGDITATGTVITVPFDAPIQAGNASKIAVYTHAKKVQIGSTINAPTTQTVSSIAASGTNLLVTVASALTKDEKLIIVLNTGAVKDEKGAYIDFGISGYTSSEITIAAADVAKDISITLDVDTVTITFDREIKFEKQQEELDLASNILLYSHDGAAGSILIPSKISELEDAGGNRITEKSVEISEDKMSIIVTTEDPLPIGKRLTVVISVDGGILATDDTVFIPATYTSPKAYVSPSIEITDKTLPSIDSIAATSSTKTVTVTFSKDITKVDGITDADNFLVYTKNGAQASDTDTANAVTAASVAGKVLTLTVTDDLVAEHRILVKVLADSVQDGEGNKNAALATEGTDIVADGTPPTIVSIEAISGSTKIVRVTFSEGITRVDGINDADNFLVYTKDGGTAVETDIANAVTAVAVGDSEVTLTVTTDLVAGHSILVKVLAGSVQDGEGNKNEELATDGTDTVADGSRPRIDSIAATSSTKTVTVTFSEEITKVAGITDADNFLVYTKAGGTAVETDIANRVTAASVAGKVLTLTVADDLVAGHRILVKVLADSVQDTANNPNEELATTGTDTVADGTPPEIDSIAATSSTKTVRVTFSETVQNAVSGNFRVFTHNGATATTTSTENRVTAADAAGNVVTLTVTTDLVAGHNILVQILANAVEDTAGNGNAAGATDGTDTVADGTPPTITGIEAISSTSTVTVTFSENVQNAVSGNFRVFTNNGATATTASTENRVTAASVAGNVVTLTVTDALVAGHNILVQILENAVEDTAGNGNAAGATDGTDTVADGTPPTITGIAATSSTKTVRVTFSETVQNAVFGNFRVFTNNGATATTASTENRVTAASVAGNVVTLTVTDNLIEGDRVLVQIIANAVEDTAGNGNAAGDTDGTYTVADGTPPTITSIAATSSTKTVRVTFSETVQNAVFGNFRVFTHNGATATTASTENRVTAASVAGNVVTLTVTNNLIEGDRVLVQIIANAVEDTAGNGNAAGDTDGTYTVADGTPPTITSIAATSSTKTVRVTFSETVQNAVFGNFRVFANNGATATTASTENRVTAASVAGNVVTLTVTNNLIEGDRVLVQIIANAVEDTAGNGNAAGDTDGTYTVADGTPPTITSIAATSSTKTVRVTFSETVQNAVFGNFRVFTNNGATATTASTENRVTAASVAGNVVTLTVTNNLIEGDRVLVQIIANAVEDTAGNGNAAGDTDGTYTVADGTPPTITGIAATGGTKTVTVTFSEEITKVAGIIDADNFLVYTKDGGTAVETEGENRVTAASVVGNEVTLTVTTDLVTGHNILVKVLAGSVEDAADNQNVARDISDTIQ